MKKLNVMFVILPSISPESFSGNDGMISHNVFPPLGVLYLANNIVDKDYISHLTCADFSIQNYYECSDIEKLVESVLKDTAQGNVPDIIAISLMFSSTYNFFSLIVKKIRQIWPEHNVKIIVGGVHASNSVEFMIKNEPVDYIVKGEADNVFADLLESIANNKPINLKGVHSQEKIRYGAGKIESTDLVHNLDISFELYPKFIDMNFYTKKTHLFSLSKTTATTPSFAIMASRGCPNQCTFCSAHTVHGRQTRWRSIKNVLDEMKWLYENYGVTKFYLMDDNFLPKQTVLEFFTALQKSGIPNQEIVIQNLSVNATDFELIKVMVHAGLTNIAFAIETGSPEMQKRIKKYCNLEKAVKLIDYSKSLGLNVRCFYMLGFPGETLELMDKTIAFAKLANADWSNFNVAVPLIGSEMYDEFIELGCIKDGPESWDFGNIRNRTFDSPWISAKEIKLKAYRANLDVNFINNPQIRNKDYKNAEMIIKNFVELNDFHIFAYDCLRRIYRLTDNLSKEKEILSRMEYLIAHDERARFFLEFIDMLDPDIGDNLKNYSQQPEIAERP